MVKDCKVILNNKAVTVIECNGIEVQLPPIKREAKTVRVIVDNGRYTVVADDYKEVINKPEEKKNKKTTIDKSAKEKNKPNIEKNVGESE